MQNYSPSAKLSLKRSKPADRINRTRRVAFLGGRSCHLRPVGYVTLFFSLLLVAGIAHAESDPTSATESSSGHQVWSATMTVGNSGGLLGYSRFGEHADGDLTNDSFSWRGTSHTVSNLTYNRRQENAESGNVIVDLSPALSDGVECLVLQLGETWLNLADARGNHRQFVWNDVDLNWLAGDDIAVGLREFSPAFEPRSVDGWGNNPIQPEFGMAGTKLLRQAPVSYAYGASAEPPPGLPGARDISNELSAQTQPMTNAAQVTDVLWQWGQFLDHDISLTPAGDPEEPWPITIPPGDPFFGPGSAIITFNRSAFDQSTGTVRLTRENRSTPSQRSLTPPTCMDQMFTELAPFVQMTVLGSSRPPPGGDSYHTTRTGLRTMGATSAGTCSSLATFAPTSRWD